jgi:UDP-N-acetylglucosamine/UDP-N-acetylgalactosamine diphosphorylase
MRSYMSSAELPDLLSEQRAAWRAHLRGERPQRQLLPWTLYEETGQALGALENGKLNAGCLILAGGEGSRLGMRGPKGTAAVTLHRKKSLFQLLFERTKAASEKAGEPLPLSLMTSPLNHEATLLFLEEHAFFGLPREQLFIFQQNLLPYLDENGNWILLPSKKFAMAPDGNGGALKGFYTAGIWEKWRALGITDVAIVPIENALADPFDEKLISAHRNAGAQMTLKCIERTDPEEKVGVLVSEGGKLRVVEYFELPLELRASRKQNGALLYPLANTGLLCARMDFIQKVGQEAALSLPWHLQRKQFFNETFWQDVWKFETFLFDLLPYAKKIHVSLYPREEVFAPLKNAQGDASLETVHEALLNADRRQYARVTGVPPPAERLFELDPAFYYPTASLLQKWRGRALPSHDYIGRDL